MVSSSKVLCTRIKLAQIKCHCSEKRILRWQLQRGFTCKNSMESNDASLIAVTEECKSCVKLCCNKTAPSAVEMEKNQSRSTARNSRMIRYGTSGKGVLRTHRWKTSRASHHGLCRARVDHTLCSGWTCHPLQLGIFRYRSHVQRLAFHRR